MTFLKRILPHRVKGFLRQVIKFFKYRYRRFAIAYPVLRNRELRIILGAAETQYREWYSTNESWLDITKPSDWEKVFRGKQLITHAVAEHVFEHLTYDECRIALRNLHSYMTHGGRIRIAIPDGNHPDAEYIRHVGIGGIGDDAADHKQLLNSNKVSELLAEAGFTPELVEGYSQEGKLVQKSFRLEDGFIARSRIHRRPKSRFSFPDAETSLIVDGLKA